MNIATLKSVAQALIAPGKGILAADESTKTITKRLVSAGIEATAENQLLYRKMLFTTPGIEEYLSGVILYDETFKQSIEGKTIPEYLSQKGIIPGIKVDKGTKEMPSSPGEKITEGLDGLRERLTEYKRLGAKFAKWRAVITIGEEIPTKECIQTNARLLAQYAASCQEQDIVPIVEPEVLMDGSHSLEKCQEVTKTTLVEVFRELEEYQVNLEGILLKPNMVTAGKDASLRSSIEEVAKATVEVLKEVVPEQVPGIVFLSGGQSPDLATEHLRVMNQFKDLPWQLSFSYGRALQDEALRIWAGKEGNIPVAQEAFLKRAKIISLARKGK